MLKHQLMKQIIMAFSAAFRRLCVETGKAEKPEEPETTAAFRRLCVETLLVKPLFPVLSSAAFRRLCVETIQNQLCS